MKITVMVSVNGQPTFRRDYDTADKGFNFDTPKQLVRAVEYALPQLRIFDGEKQS